jgi:hypothetical protein
MAVVEVHDFILSQELQRLVEILELTHELLSKHVKIDPFNVLMGEMTQSISLVSFSGRIATQVRMHTCHHLNILMYTICGGSAT